MPSAGEDPQTCLSWTCQCEGTGRLGDAPADRSQPRLRRRRPGQSPVLPLPVTLGRAKRLTPVGLTVLTI